MKKIIILSVSILAMHTVAFAANVPWWEQPTVCKLDSTNCYQSMGAGYDRDAWDNTSNCRGVKLICPDALSGATEPTPIERDQVSKRVNRDFDADILNGDCFGARKTTDNGAKAMLNGTYVNVWCHGVLTDETIEMPTGEIATGRQPTCESLAANGYVAVLDNRCYGKQYAIDEYRIECGTSLVAKRVVKLNGAEFNNRSTSAPADQTAANKIFDVMEAAARVARADKFGGK